MTPLDRAILRLWLSLPFVRRSRRLGMSTRRMLALYVLGNLWFMRLIEAGLSLLTTGRLYG